MDKTETPDTSASMFRDKAALILFGIGLVLIVLTLFAEFAFVRTGHAQLLMVAMVLTGAFALAGITFGLMRSLRPAKRR